MDIVKGVVFAIVGLILLTAVGALALGERSFLSRSVCAVGVVTSENEGPAHVTVRFTTASGKTVSYPQNGMIFQHTGDTVTVRYDPFASNPGRDAVIATLPAEWGDVVCLGGLGAVFAAVSTGLIAGTLRESRRRKRLPAVGE